MFLPLLWASFTRMSSAPAAIAASQAAATSFVISARKYSPCASPSSVSFQSAMPQVPSMSALRNSFFMMSNLRCQSLIALVAMNVSI